MSLAEHFDSVKNKNHHYAFKKLSDFTLCAHYDGGYGGLYYTYDFLARVVVIQNNYSSSNAATITPFDQMNRESLTFFRDKLIELQGNPPELSYPQEAKIRKKDGKGLAI